jgi:hypothetical protein
MRYWQGAELLNLCSAQIRKIAYIAPQNNDVGFGTGFADNRRAMIGSQELQEWQGGSG